MRPRYHTRAIVLARTPLAEASALLYLLTPEFGLVKARAQGVRKEGAKLASATQTFSEFDAVLVRGKDGWRLLGAVLVESWFKKLAPHARARAARVARLVLRLVHGESSDSELYTEFRNVLEALLAQEGDDEGESIEILAALFMLRSLGLDAGPLPPQSETYVREALSAIKENKHAYIVRVNRGIAASGL